ncbi:MAG: hypothetical protein ABI859_02930 [Pseudomonadota bacterium]
MPASPTSPSIPGPVDREDFFAAQRRHRRAAQLLNLLAGFAVVLVSVPLAAIVFPLLFFVLAVLSMLVSAVTGVPSLVDWVLGTGGHFAEGPDAFIDAIMLGLVVVLPARLAYFHARLNSSSSAPMIACPSSASEPTAGPS